MSTIESKFHSALEGDNRSKQGVWDNVFRADGAIAALYEFYIENTTENTSNKYYFLGTDNHLIRNWNDPSFEATFVKLFDELGDFLLAQPSDDLALMTLRTAIRRNQLSMATDLTQTRTWSDLAGRLWPLMEN